LRARRPASRGGAAEELARLAAFDDDPGTPVCASPAYWLEFARGAPDVTLSGDGSARWAEDVSFHGTLDDGVFTIDR
jgi:hypothetical protein